MPNNMLLFLGSLYCGGSERVVTNLANHWVSSGTIKNLEIITGTPVELDFYTIDPKIQRSSLNYNYSKIGISEQLKRFFNLRKKITSHNGPVVSFGTGSNLQILLAGILTGKKIFVVEHTNHKAASKTKNLLRNILYRLANGVLVQTDRDLAYYRKFLKNIFVMPSPIPIPPEQKEEKEKMILGVGRLVNVKGYDLLIKSLSPILKKYPEWKVVILGEGNDRDKLQKMINENECQERFLLKGAVKDVDSYYSKSSIFVLSSRLEGLPTVLCEAMSHGVACVSFDCETGPREIISTSETGVLVPPLDVKGLRTEVETLILDENKRHYLGTQARKSIIERYSPQAVTALWENVFENFN